MSLRRTLEVCRLDFRHHLTRPLFWILVAILALMAIGLSSGALHISSKNSDVGGQKAWITSDFANARILALLTTILFCFFVAVGAGMVAIRDEETKVGEVLHSSSLRPSEYVWGKFLAITGAFLFVLALQLGFHAVANHALVSAEKAEFVGPFRFASYLRPAIVFALPAIVFFAGTTFAIGEWTRRPIPVFFLPVASVLACGFFLWTWSPTWLDPRLNRVLMLVDPSGARWLTETWLKVDRGAEFYNHTPVPLDAGFVASRIGFVLIGFLAVWTSQMHLSATLRGRRARAGDRRTDHPAVALHARSRGEPGPLADLGMKRRPPGFVRSALEVARVEARELRASAGLYLFVPLILVQTVGMAMIDVGWLDTPLLYTSGLLAQKSMNTLTFLICALLLFYTTESLERERARGLSPIHSATSTPTFSILLGKSLANSVVAVVILFAAFLAAGIVLLVQGRVGLELRPFLLVWGLLLLPTFILWSSFLTAAYSVCGNRFANYGIGLGVLLLTGYAQMRGWNTWVSNWNLWDAVQWSDLGTFELLRQELWLNRLLALASSAMFLALSVRFFPRRSADASGILARLAPRKLLGSALRFSPWIVAPCVLAIWLENRVEDGFQGDSAEKLAKDYWAKNVKTWTDAPMPSIAEVDLDLELDPARRWFRANGTYTLRNDRESPFVQIPLTRGFHWENPEWSIDGEKVEPEDRAGLCVFTPKTPLAPGASLKLGFRHEGVFPKGATKNGGGLMEFILPSGVVVSSFGPAIVPTLGFMEGLGVDDDNRSDAKVYPDDFHEGITDSWNGSNTPSTTHIRVRAPEEYTINSVGTLVSDEVTDGMRTVVWESDHPVNFFNVIAGRWDVRRGEGTAIYYHPEHTYNIDRMISCLDASRRWYSEWFRPYPWKELKLSQFPGLDSYAQGFPTNITFSETVGFLTDSDSESDLAFFVTAHEAAHQWWGNILSPGKGPGGNILSEGMANFSTILLTEKEKGLNARIELCKKIESQYGDRRQVDSEKPLVEIDGSRDGDTTVTYDKGGWVFWMLLNRMGREQDLAGLRTFIRKYENGPDHPVLQDFVATMRELALEKESYDDFVKQWFFEVVVPEYRLEDATKTRIVGALTVDDGLGRSDAWEVRVRVENAGTGRMPVEIAAARGERFPDEGEKEANAPENGPHTSPGTVQAAAPSEARPKTTPRYQDARTTITLGAGESQEVVIRCDFEPERVLVDPDALVLQLQRKLAVNRF